MLLVRLKAKYTASAEITPIHLMLNWKLLNSHTNQYSVVLVGAHIHTYEELFVYK